MKEHKNKKERKAQLRTSYLQKRNAMERETQIMAGKKIKDRVLAMKQVKLARTVFLYASYQSEVPTKELLQELLAAGKRVALPKVSGERMDFYAVTAWEELMPGYHGILEPESHGAEPVFPKEGDVMLLPGAVFDKKGNRIGYGKGYYDRYLSELEAAYRRLPYCVGLCYHKQLWKGILPTEDTDRCMDAIVTERKVIAVKTEPGRFDWLVDIAEGIAEFVLEFALDLLD
ncbi:MAG: 5-formyltetrahydrofolate cyclo-ligase [Lachnospiraceae bacterium]